MSNGGFGGIHPEADPERSTTVPAIKEAGDSALLLELEPVIDTTVNARAIAIAAAVRDDVIPGVRDVVSTYRSVAVHFDPLVADARDVQASLERAAETPASTVHGRLLEIPVECGGQWGPDIADVASLSGQARRRSCGATASAIIACSCWDSCPALRTGAGRSGDRRSAPFGAARRVRAGSIGIAGQQTGVYPLDSPGGWQIVGHTFTRMFDVEQWPVALLAPGDSVRFVPQPHEPPPGMTRASGGALSTTARRSITVIEPGLLTTIQDAGRWGHQTSGVPVSGAMDWVAYRTANALVANEPGSAVVEATLTGPKLRFDQRTTFAIAGADFGATLDECARAALRGCHRSRRRRPSLQRAGVWRRGHMWQLTEASMFRAFSAVRSTHLLSRMGGTHGRTLLQGDRLGLGVEGTPNRRRKPIPDATAYGRGGGARLRVLPGPQTDYFPDEAMDLLQRTRFIISPQSNRMGYRLQGDGIPRLLEQEMISDAAFAGAIQVPPSGDPILLLADP